MKAWKILTSRTFGELVRGADCGWYMALGKPLVRQSGLRGTMLAVFNESFVCQRLPDVDYWSPADLGGVAAGFSPINANAAALLRLPPRSLPALLDRSQTDPALFEAVYHHTALPHSLLTEFMTQEAASALTDAPYEPQSWMYEVALSRIRAIEASELMRLYIPRAAVSWVNRLMPGLPRASVKVYNSALGLENSVE